MPRASGAFFRAVTSFCLVVSPVFLNSGCYAYHITANRVPPSTEARSQTQVAYAWGLAQPNDIIPPNCPKNVPLADVTAHTNLGYVLVATVTLGIVVIHELEWRCAKIPSVVDMVLAPHSKQEG